MSIHPSADPVLDAPHLSALRELARDGTLSQRELAARLGVSLGRTNYLVRALIGKGLVKARRFKNARNKLAYRYALTPEGVLEKVRVTRRFLEAKVLEYEALRREIEQLSLEVSAAPGFPEEAASRETAAGGDRVRA
jgi:EPS-associated MarR family transcriptional regulator